MTDLKQDMMRKITNMKFILLAIWVFPMANLIAQNFNTLEMPATQQHGHYGWDITIDGEWMAVSSPNLEIDSVKNVGKVDIYQLQAGSWVLMQELSPENGDAFQHFGYSIAMKDGILAAGAVGDFTRGPFCGAMFVFELSGEIWEQTSVVFPNDTNNGMFFGYDVATNGTIIIASALLGDGDTEKSGAVYAFSKMGDTWVQDQKIVAGSSQANDRFGCSIAINNENTIVVGAYHHSVQADKSGAAFVYENEGGSWNLKKTLLPSVFHSNDMFGYSLAMYRNEIAIGAFHAHGEEENSGLVFIFDKLDENWEEVQYIAALGGKRNDFFGISVGITKDKLIVGASRRENVEILDAGSVYCYEKIDSKYSNEKEIFEPLGSAYNSFGITMAIDESEIAVSSRLNDSREFDGGSVYHSAWAATSSENELVFDPVLKVKSYPNPTTNSVTISYFLPFTATVELRIFSTSGKLQSMVISETQQPGKHTAVWNCRTSNGNSVPPGVYFYQLSVNGNLFNNKIIVSE